MKGGIWKYVLMLCNVNSEVMNKEVVRGGPGKGLNERWWDERDRVQEYVRERGGGSLRNLEQARRECQDIERWKLFCRGHPLVGAPRSRHRNE